jgi:hypothetical protein
MAVNVKMGVDIGSFKQGIREGQQILKSLDAEMKVTEAEFKATGNAEKQMADKTRILTSQMNVQKGVIDQMQKALKRMADAGVQPTDQAYQKLNAQMLNAQAAMYQTQAELNNLDGSQQKAAGSADKLTNSLSGIGKKLSLDQVISGINSVTGALENAGKKALSVGQDIWNMVMDRAKWADDTSTMALMYGIDLDTFQRMQKLVTNGLDTSVEAILTAQDKLKKGIGKGNKEVMEYMTQLGLMYESGKGGTYSFITDDTVEMFWKAGQAVMAMGDAYDQEAAAQALFGRSWKELVPLFKEYKSFEEYNEALQNVQVNSEEDVNALAELNDRVSELKGNLETLSTDILATLAPALNDAATALNGVLTSVLEYLKTEQGQEMLKSMSDSVSQLFSGLGDIDPESVVENFTTVFNGLVGGLQWIVDNKEGVIAALGAIVAGWGALKITGGALEIVKLVNGIAGLAGSGAVTAASEAGAAAGSSWGAAFGAAVLKAIPWLAGLITLATPSGGDEQYDVFVDKNGKVTEAGKAEGITQEEVDIANAVKEGVTAGIAQSESSKTTKSGAKVIDLTYDTMIPMIADNLNGGLTLHLDADELSKEWQGLFGGGNKENEPELPVRPELPADAQQQLQNAMDSWNPMKIYVTPIINEPQGNLVQGHANGLPWVPYDGYLAMLHRGERVLTASENRSYTYNSNNYFGNVNLNNGQDIDALCDSIDRHNRRQRNGYGS